MPSCKYCHVHSINQILIREPVSQWSDPCKMQLNKTSHLWWTTSNSAVSQSWTWLKIKHTYIENFALKTSTNVCKMSLREQLVQSMPLLIIKCLGVVNDRREPVNLTMQLHKSGSCVFLPKQQTIYASLSRSQVILVDLSNRAIKLHYSSPTQP